MTGRRPDVLAGARRALAPAVALLVLAAAACGGDAPAAAREYLESGNRYVRRGRDAAAVIEYRNAIRLAPTLSRAHVGLAQALARLGRHDEAQRAQEAADRTVADRALPEDEAGLRAVIDAHPQHVGARLALAQQLIARGDPGEAETHLRAALASDPGRELANRALAALLVAAVPPRTAEAEPYLRRAAAAVPQRYNSQLALADFLFAQQRWRDMAAVLDAAGADATLADAVALRRVALRDAAGDPAGARRELRGLVDAHPSADAWALLAEYAWRDGDREAAADAARQALTLDPNQRAADSILEAARWQQVRPLADAPGTDAARTGRTAASERR